MVSSLFGRLALGMFKLVINQLDKIFITSDTATIVKEMDVVHPAAKLLVEAAQKQEQEVFVLLIVSWFLGGRRNELCDYFCWRTAFQSRRASPPC